MRLAEHIRRIEARQIITSRGRPTVEVDFITGNGVFRSSVPEGASKGSREAAVVADGGRKYNGRSVQRVVDGINGLADRLLSAEIDGQDDFDRYLISVDGTECKTKLGANLILPLSVCFCKWISDFRKMRVCDHIERTCAKEEAHAPGHRMPSPHFNVLNGGMHSGNGFWCQEMMVVFGNEEFSDNLESACIFYEALKKVIGERFGYVFTAVGDEGGFSPPIKTAEEGIELLMKAGEESKIGNFRVAFDFAANKFYTGGRYHISTGAGDHSFTGRELADFYAGLLTQYPIVCSMEDPFSEDDLDSWSYFYGLAGDRVNIVADDLTVTNPGIIGRLGALGMFNTVLIKPNQIGSVSETLEAVRTARGCGHKIMVSHRSGETEDTFICDLAVGTGSEYIKCGAPCRGERVAKYNELLRIEEHRKTN